MGYYTISEGEYQEHESITISHTENYSYSEFMKIVEEAHKKVMDSKNRFESYHDVLWVSLNELVQMLCDNYGFVEIEPFYDAWINNNSYHDSNLVFSD